MTRSNKLPVTYIFRCSFCGYQEERSVPNTKKDLYSTAHASESGHIPGHWMGRWPGKDETLCYGALWRDELKEE